MLETPLCGGDFSPSRGIESGEARFEDAQCEVSGRDTERAPAALPISKVIRRRSVGSHPHFAFFWLDW